MKIWQEFRRWLVVAKVGEQFPYHNGLLARDRERSLDVDFVAQDAMLAARQGLVLLFQRRLPYTSPLSGEEMGGGCLYIARRTQDLIP